MGFPNAGKSSLLAALSKAAPKIAAYPFTTLHPTVGVVHLHDAADSLFSLADIPGLVEGAHRNVGLGFEFLRHVERTKVLLYVVDVARPLRPVRAVTPQGRESVTDLGDPVAEFVALRKELALYSPELAQRPR